MTAEYLEAPSVAVGGFSGRVRNEKSDSYCEVIAVLTPRLRVIKGNCNLQWVLQKKDGRTEWKGFAFCATKAGLILRIKEHLQAYAAHLGEGQPRDAKKIIPLDVLVSSHCDPEAWATIEALSEHFPKEQA